MSAQPWLRCPKCHQPKRHLKSSDEACSACRSGRLTVAQANAVARKLDEQMNGAGPRMLASASRELVDTATPNPRRLSEEDIAAMREMREAGATFQAIADAYGVSNAWAWQLLTSRRLRESGGPSGLASTRDRGGPPDGDAA